MCVCVLVVSVMSPLSLLIRADCIYIQWQEKVNVAVINSCISIRERERERWRWWWWWRVKDAGGQRDRLVPCGRAGNGQSDVG